MMGWTILLEEYGYSAVMIGAFFEGEAILMLGSYAVQQHVLSFWPLILFAMLGGFFGFNFIILSVEDMVMDLFINALN